MKKLIFSLVVVAAVAISAVVVTSCGNTQTQGESVSDQGDNTSVSEHGRSTQSLRWEYKQFVIATSDYGPADVITQSGLSDFWRNGSLSVVNNLNRLGNEGWELVSVTAVSHSRSSFHTHIVYVFKRRL